MRLSTPASKPASLHVTGWSKNSSSCCIDDNSCFSCCSGEDAFALFKEDPSAFEIVRVLLFVWLGLKYCDESRPHLNIHSLSLFTVSCRIPRSNG